MAMRRGNPLFWTHPQRPTLSPSLRREGSEMQGRRQGRRPRAYTLCWGLHLANDCMAVVCIRLWGRSLHPIAGAVPCAGPTIMFDRFSIPCLYPHVGRTPIMHYALRIMHWKDNVRPLFHPLFAPACWANANYALCSMHWKGNVRPLSIPCLYPHVGRTPILHYALCIMHCDGLFFSLS